MSLRKFATIWEFQMTSQHGNHAVDSNQFAGDKTNTGMGPTCTHRAIARHAGVVWLDRKTIMAAETSAIVKEAKKQTCILVKEDVLGVALTRESVEQCSAVQPKRWLTCRGAKTSRKHFFLCTQTIPGWFAIALWAHVGPIPLLVLFPANSQGIVFMQKFSVGPNLNCRPN